MAHRLIFHEFWARKRPAA